MTITDKPRTFVDVVNAGDYVILDTETTGIKYPAEICEIAIVDPDGYPLINTLIKTAAPIPMEAQRIHGIKDMDVQYAPTWSEALPDIIQVLTGKDLIIYNAQYDLKMLKWSCDLNNLVYIPCWRTAWCAMLEYAEYAGVWNEYHGNYAWHKLTNAVRRERLTVGDAHRALGDCIMTNALIKHMAANPKLKHD